MLDFDTCFGALHGDGRSPFPWQRRLFERFVAGEPPTLVDIPTGLGKTSAIAAWLIARAFAPEKVANRLAYVVDRRTVVDQATDEAEKLRAALAGDAPALSNLKTRLGCELNESIAVSTLRGQHVDNKDWLANPTRPAIIIGTVDMIGSRLLFEGYGVSRKQRAIHAGLLGMDCLVLLDEAHLVPPFQALIEAVAGDKDDSRPLGLWPRSRARALRVTALSATGRSIPVDDRIALDAADHAIETVARRIHAVKPIQLEPLKTAPTPAAFVAKAMDLTSEGASDVRVVVFVTAREEAGKIADGLKAALAKTTKGKKVAERAKPDERVELLVGARRVHERELARMNLQRLGFLPGEPSTAPIGCATYLVATSAGEVGIDLDADIMIADAVPLERLAQRLGRINRRGDKNETARVVVFDPQEPPKDDRERRARAARDVIRNLPITDAGLNASPAALSALRARLPDEVANASSPPPLRPALTKPLVEAWSMTSLKAHTGRPEVAPWLRGWEEDEERQLTVVFRRHLPVMADGSTPSALLETYFEAAPIQMAERLETTGPQASSWLLERIAPRRRKAAAEDTSEEPGDAAVPTDAEDEVDDGETELAPTETGVDTDPNEKVTAFIRKAGVVALLLDRELALLEAIRVPRRETGLSATEEKRILETIKKRVAGAPDGSVLVVWSGVGGLSDGLLNGSHDADALAADLGLAMRAPFEITFKDSRPDAETPVADATVVLERDTAGMPKAWLEIISTGNNLANRDDEDRKAIVKERQTLASHQADVVKCLNGILTRLAELVTETERQALRLAAAYHDQGKAADRWQKAFRGTGALTERRQPGDPLLVGGPYAKSDCTQPNQQILGGYRHEFGTLLDETLLSALDAVDPDTADLALHLIAAHHGFARPVISTDGIDQVPPSRAAAEATAVALRFARLQTCYGPWRLAWLEALLRAADVSASKTPTKEADHG